MVFIPFLINAAVPAPVFKWRNGGFSLVQFNKGLYTSPALLDIDQDGTAEIIWANFKVLAFNGNAGSIIWSFWAGNDRSGPDVYHGIGTDTNVVVADINRDGFSEIITAHTNGLVCAYDRNGYFLSGFPLKPMGRSDPIESLSVFDLDHDGYFEIIIGWGMANNLNVCVIGHDGTVKAGWPQYVPNPNANALGIFGQNIAVGDINKDGFGELVVPSDTGKTCAYFRDGNTIPVNPLFGSGKKWPDVTNYENYDHEKAGYYKNGRFYMGTEQPAAIADVNMDGSNEIVIVGVVFSNPDDYDYQALYTTPFIYNLDRTRFKDAYWNWENSLPQSGTPLINDWTVMPLKRTNPVVVDLDGDGKKEILSSSFDGKLHCYWLDKTEHGNWPFSVYDSAEGRFRFSSEPVVADLDSDGSLEVIFTSWPQYYSNTGGHLFILDHQGTLLHKISLPYGDNGDVGALDYDGCLAAPTIGDVDGDGQVEIILGTVYAGLVVYDLPGAVLGSAPWPTGRHDYARTGWADYIPHTDGIRIDLIGTWDSQGVYYRNSLTGLWVKLATPATLITAGDLDGDGTDDLIGIWPGQGGVWVKYSKTGAWAKLSSTARDFSAGDMNGDGLDDLLATWDDQGVYYRHSISGAWVKMATPATQVTAGDLDGDGKDDLIGIWPSQGGVWVKYSQNGNWARLGTTAVDIAAGDMNGDGRDDLVATWDGQGVYYKDSISGAWVGMASPATLVTAGDLDGDGKDDVIGIWPSQGGVWVKYSKNGNWEQLSSTARHIATGLMRRGSGSSTTLLAEPLRSSAEGPESLGFQSIATTGPGDRQFQCREEKNLIPQYADAESELLRMPGPGEFGFQCQEQDNPLPGSGNPKESKAKELNRHK